MSPEQLKSALKVQKTTQKPLGQICIEARYVRSIDIVSILACQFALRVCAAIMISFVTLGFGGKRSFAGKIKDLSPMFAVSSEGVRFAKPGYYPALFGAEERRSDNLTAFTKWSDMFDRFDTALHSKAGQRVMDELKRELSFYQSDSIFDMAQDVNHLMNKKKYIVDNENWGKSDYWATPVEFLARGGDCEDFAIAKYMALRALGVPESRLRIAIVQDEQKNIPHAILIAYSEKGPLVLDNQIKDVLKTTEINHYRPIFSINREAWWLHTAPEEPTTTVVAAAE